MNKLQFQIIDVAISLLVKHPDDMTVHREQSKIIKRILREIKPYEKEAGK